MLEFSSVSFSIGRKKIIDSISHIVQKGDFIIILGHNGAGKSTLFDLICGKQIPTKGTITLHGKDITQIGEVARSQFIGRLHQNPRNNVISSMTVRENLALSLYKNQYATLRSGLKCLEDQFTSLLSGLFHNVETILETKMSNLSGGQQQTIAALMITAHQPEIVLLDEPTAALDPNAATNVLQFLHKQIQKNKTTTLLITHDPYIALHLGNKIWILEHGKIKKEIDKSIEKEIHPEQLIGHIVYERL